MTHRVGLLAACLLAGCGEEIDSGSSAATPSPWDGYSIPAPEGETLVALTETPFLWPEEVCVDAAGLSLPEDTALVPGEGGTEQLCVNDNFSGNVPEGLAFTDVLTCDRAFTQGPSWFAPPGQVHTSDPGLLDDEVYVAELDWVSDQILASGCACCHASAADSGHVSGFDVTGPGVWTDSMTNAQLAMAAGRFPEHLLFGHYDAADNHGFDRTETLFASTDPERMRAFFEGEMARRGADQEDLDEAQGQFDALFGRLSEAPIACTAPYEGVVDGRLTWNGDGVRQLYILEVGADAPGFPPNLHLPEGTVWALFVEPDAEPVLSGAVAPGEVPAGAWQAFPADGAPPVLEEGTTYTLYASPDVMNVREANCTFTWTAPAGG